MLFICLNQINQLELIFKSTKKGPELEDLSITC